MKRETGFVSRGSLVGAICNYHQPGEAITHHFSRLMHQLAQNFVEMFVTLNNASSLPGPGTVRGVLDRIIDEFEKEGIENPRYEAEGILSYSLGNEAWELYTKSGRVLTRDENTILKRSCEDRLSHCPLAYIQGRTGFYNLELKTDPRSLIPRPDTELLVERAIAFLEEHSIAPAKVVDLGCGSGVIALALAREYPAAIIGASDISPSALELARENAELTDLAHRVEFRQGDLFSPWQDRSKGGFDLILSNPPYLSDREWEESPAEVRLYEPPEALRAESDGLDVIRRLIRESSRHLKPGGALIFEIGYEQGTVARELVEMVTDFISVEVIKDYSGHDRVIEAIKNVGSDGSIFPEEK